MLESLNYTEVLFSHQGTESQTVTEALRGPYAHHWQKAMDDEFRSLLKNKTRTLIPLPPGRKTIGCKWIFKIKYKANGEVDRYKARLVAKGYSQVKGIDYHDIFSPVVKITSLLLLFAIGALLDLEIHQMDVKMAFLNGDLVEIIYMDQPKGYISIGQEYLVCSGQRPIRSQTSPTSLEYKN